MNSQTQTSSREIRSNFSHLAPLDNQLVRLGALAEKYFAEDPNTSMVKTRQFGEYLAQAVASRVGIYSSTEEAQLQLLRRLQDQGILPRDVAQLFHQIRITGNAANHAGRDDHGAALNLLKFAAQLGLWFQRTFGKADLKSGPFVPPSAPRDESDSLRFELERLRSVMESERSARDEAVQRLTSLEARLRETDDERSVWEQIAQEAEADKSVMAQRLARIQSESEVHTRTEIDFLVKSSLAASGQVVLDEAATRKIIDSQLSQVGWTVDTETLTHARGARPKVGRNLAISEWPTRGKQSADYVLFAGLVPVAVVEAKRANIDVAGKISQAERYSRGFEPDAARMAWSEEGLAEPWTDGRDGSFQIPFAYSTNSRPYHKQVQEKSGTWFRDLRHASNTARPLQQFHGPEELLDLLRRSREESENALREEPFGYLNLRDYQERAIVAVEKALAADQRQILVAMATGTGKTRTIIGLMYRLLKAERFKRILFLVDRTALGDQAREAFDEAPLEQNLPLSRIYNVAELGDMAAQAETRIQVATVQAMVKRVFDSSQPPTIGTYDCIIVDEAHRGYTLDQEMTDGEMEVRDFARYLSSYRRVLDYFDAVKVGMTATPAKHTTEIFGKPVYTYSYPEAVIDDWLIDHEPPIRFETELTRKGIHFEKGATVQAVNTRTGTLDTTELEDDLHFDVAVFNRSVITESFNQVVCDQLVQELDPFGEEKTLIFCATDLHADMVKRLLNEAFLEAYGSQWNQAAVEKITGQSDRIKELIKRYKNERWPNIAITVDLLTTGIDVPKIGNLVFLRRVRSRILFEQMIGRATRRCDEIGKTVFRIYDPVDIYADLEDVNTMKPLVKDPGISITDLITEMDDPRSAQAPGLVAGTTHTHDLLAAIAQKTLRILRRAAHKASVDPVLRSKLDDLERLWGVPPASLHKHLLGLGPQGAQGFLRTFRQFPEQLEDIRLQMGSDRYPLVSHEPDRFGSRSQAAGNGDRPDDYLESFAEFVKGSLNESVALSVVVNRPRDLTRAQLREIQLLLVDKGYSETSLRVAWRNKTNHEIAAGIVAFIRQAALGEELVPYPERVSRAMAKIRALRAWTPMQLKWLDRIAKQLVDELVIDTGHLNEVFAPDGGLKGLDRHLGHQLDAVLEALAQNLWAA